MKKKEVIPCGVAIVRRGGDILIAQRNENDTYGLFWEFPGGKKNYGETYEECALRETREETGVRVRVEKKLIDVRKNFRHKVIWLHFYLCRYESGQARPLDCRDVRWVGVNRLRDFRFPPANRTVIEKLEALSCPNLTS